MKSITKIVLTSVAASVFFISVTATSVYAKNHADRIRIDYVAPDDPQLRKIHDILKERRVLERLQEFLSPYRLPRDLDVQLTDCDGESDAWYGDDEITICYEYINVLWQRMPAETTPSGVAPIDTVIGPFMDTTLHEFAHALFDMLSIPVLGREEDAADQVGAYIYLQLGNEEAKRLITGTAHAFLVEAEGRRDVLQGVPCLCRGQRSRRLSVRAIGVKMLAARRRPPIPGDARRNIERLASETAY